ncbi:TIGR02206 family membrane protein [Salinicoccus albus]|uniref:YwaF family protein n=1 Tax=Salinicoccus albus TaxID=418756 RepID=UPI00037106FE|nr:TIGR02206 family membrane protein [Salinicoccus albus]
MNWFWDGAVSTVEVGGAGHIVYIMLLVITFAVIYRQRHRFRGRLLCIYISFTILGIIHQLMVTSWYIFEIGYELSNALPLHICRVAVWLIILQFFVKRTWLTEVIFFFGLYAYGSFALPIAIHPPFHFAGWTFVLMHTMIIIYPFVIHWTTGWIPTFKGAVLSFGLFLIYFVLVLIVNGQVDANYFYLNNRPFLHDMADIPYMLLNVAGTFGIFMLGLLLSRVLLKFEKREY